MRQFWREIAKRVSQNPCLVAHVEFLDISAFRQLAAQRISHQRLSDRPGILSHAIIPPFPKQLQRNIAQRAVTELSGRLSLRELQHRLISRGSSISA